MPWETMAPLKDGAELGPLRDWTVGPEVSTACSPPVLPEERLVPGRRSLPRCS